MKSILNEKELMEATGYRRRSLLEKCLRKHKIKFHYGRGGQIWTTVDALNSSLGIKEINPEEKLDFI